MKVEKSGQISIEYLVIVGFVAFVIIVIFGVAIFYSNGVKDSLAIYQLNNFAKKVISSGESVFYAGTPSQVTINAYLPSGINSITIQGKEIDFSIETSSGTNVIIYNSNVNIEGSISTTSGTKVIKLAAQSDKVNIAEV